MIDVSGELGLDFRFARLQETSGRMFTFLLGGEGWGAGSACPHFMVIGN